jgi:hypothetical protein
VKQAVVLSVTTSAAAGAAATVTSSLSVLTSSAGKLLIGLGAALVGAGGTFGVVTVHRSLKAPATATARPKAGPDTRIAVPMVKRDDPALGLPSERIEEPLGEVIPPRVSQKTLAPDVRVVSPPLASRIDERSTPLEKPTEHAPTPDIPRSEAERSPERRAIGPSRTADRAQTSFLAGELAMLRLSLSHKESGRAEDALSTLNEYLVQFPEGALTLEALALRVMVLCELGRVEEAKKAFEGLASTTGSSPVLERVRTSCVAQ